MKFVRKSIFSHCALILVGLGLLGFQTQALGASLKGKSKVADKAALSPVLKAITQDPQWLNTSRPLKPEDLKGRIILLDFWTFCCINCIHVMPDLKALESQFKNDLTVIGVHSAKFNNEKDTENIRNAIIRYGLEHPVVNDASFRIWDSFQVQAWPTLILINPAGQVEDVFPGEGQKERISEAISALRKKYSGQLNHRKLPIQLEREKAAPGPLSFPGKITYVSDYEKSPLLIVSDSSHDRIAGLRANGDLVFSVGKTGESGFKDGDFATARFDRPQGVLYEPGFIYVADTGNHRLRRIDLNLKKVETLAGTGEKGSEIGGAGEPALQTSLNSPWDLAFYPDQNHIAIAMAGIHQIWSYDKIKKTVSAIAGDGKESIVDGPSPDNSLAQPSGLSAEGSRLYFVDAESSSLRYLENGSVKTLIGSGLFNFGFKDGSQGEALLQHDIGVAVHDGGVYVVDSYNHAIRRYDLKKGILETLAGTNIRGDADGDFKEARFNEPNGLVFASGSEGTQNVAYVTDTNNNKIRILDFDHHRVKTLKVHEKESISVRLAKKLPNLKKDGELDVAAEIPLDVHLKLDKGWHINQEAPSYLALFESGKGARETALKVFGKAELQSQKVLLPALKPSREYRLQGIFYFCQIKEGSACQLQSHDQILRTVDGARGSRAFNIAVTSQALE